MENSSQTQLSDQDASNSTHKLEVTVWCAVFAAETVAIVIGNLLTAIIFARDASVRKPSSYLIMSLALADLFIGLFTLPLWIYQSEVYEGKESEKDQEKTSEKEAKNSDNKSRKSPKKIDRKAAKTNKNTTRMARLNRERNSKTQRKIKREKAGKKGREVPKSDE
ncbi:hypothetical protein ACROYT_G016888 [Oculina patagonica]